MVNRGPQWVQLMKGWPKRRSAGSASSARQAAHVDVSGEIRVCRCVPVRLATMVKARSPRGATGSVVTRSITASGGASRRNAW
jgi:hypothetical protein